MQSTSLPSSYAILTASRLRICAIDPVHSSPADRLLSVPASRPITSQKGAGDSIFIPGEEIVLDLFGRSSSTLVEFEHTGRHVCLMELDAMHRDVIVQPRKSPPGESPVDREPSLSRLYGKLSCRRNSQPLRLGLRRIRCDEGYLESSLNSSPYPRRS